MKKLLKMELIYIMLIIVFIIGCSETNKIIGRYYIGATDYVDEETTLYYENDNKDMVGVVQPTVFSVGYNNKYIFVKQHPENNKKITNYYIVTIHKENTYWPEKGIFGPFTHDKFNEKCKELQIADKIKFTIEIDGLK